MRSSARRSSPPAPMCTRPGDQQRLDPRAVVELAPARTTSERRHDPARFVERFLGRRPRRRSSARRASRASASESASAPARVLGRARQRVHARGARNESAKARARWSPGQLPCREAPGRPLLQLRPAATGERVTRACAAAASGNRGWRRCRRSSARRRLRPGGSCQRDLQNHGDPQKWREKRGNRPTSDACGAQPQDLKSRIHRTIRSLIGNETSIGNASKLVVGTIRADAKRLGKRR